MTDPGGDLRKTRLAARRFGLVTQDEPVALVRADSPVSHAEGLAPRSQVVVSGPTATITATLYHVTSKVLRPNEIGLSEAAWARLGVESGAEVEVRHPLPLESLARVRRRIFGERLGPADFSAILRDIVEGRYAEAHLAAFVTACSALPLDLNETTELTRAMVDVGRRLTWKRPVVLDKHSIGGLPGNRTTPIVVSIAAALGLVIPKTSSRAITSSAGTADTMEVLTRVDLEIDAVRQVVEMEGGCFVWGGRMSLSPADEIIARMGRTLEMDAVGQLVSSILSKKIAAGSNHVIIDIPVGPTAKMRTPADAQALAERLVSVGRAFGLQVRCVITDGLQPVGRGIGPALEARDVLAVLQGAPEAPRDLRERALALAGAVLELGGAACEGGGVDLARTALDDGRAWAKFQAICRAQGTFRSPPRAPLTRVLPSSHAGTVVHLNNRKLAKLAKLAGAPEAKAAGLELHVKIGDEVVAVQAMMTLHAQAVGELDYAGEYARANPDIIGVEL